MGRYIASIIRVITLTLLLTAFPGVNAHAYSFGQIQEKPVEIITAPGKFTFLSTLNPCDWGFSPLATTGKEMYYTMTLEESMDVTLLTLGSDIYCTEIKMLGPDGTRVQRAMSSAEYQDMLKEEGRWDDDTYFVAQDCFMAYDLVPGTYRITVQGIKGGNYSATNGPVRLTVIGYDLFNFEHSFTAPDSIPGTRQCPFPIGRFNREFSTTVNKSRSDMPPRVSEMFFTIELAEAMPLSFDYDGSQYQISLFQSNPNNFTVLQPTTDDGSGGIEFNSGTYLLWIKLLSDDNDAVYFSIKGGADTSTTEPETPPVQPDKPKPDITHIINKNYIRTRTYLDAGGTDYREETLYADGLGRQSQKILTAGSPDGSDLVWRSDYDTSGRPVRNWLPGLSSTGGYAPHADIDYSHYGGDTAPYSLTEYEPSTLNRPRRQYGPGDEWQSSGTAVIHEYDTSSASGELSCYCYSVSATPDTPEISVTCKGRYLSGELLVERVTDEDGRVSLVFTDGFGRKVLDRRVLEDGVYADTYYVYDIYDNLTVVIPPEGSAGMAGVGVWTASSSALSDYCYLYYFDRLHRMVGKKLPGCDRTETAYTSTSQPVVWRGGNLRAAGRWQFLITDIRGHEVITGTCSSYTYTSPIVFGVPSGYTIQPMPELQDIVPHVSLFGYDVYGLELVDPEVLTVSYYDDYSFTGLDCVAGGDSLSFRPGSRTVELYPSARGMLTGRLTAVPVSTSSDSLEYLASAYYYDHRGRTVQSVEANRLGGYDRTTTEYDYVDNPIFTELTHTTAANPTGILQQWEREYDSQGRELAVRHRLGSGQWITLSTKEYDALGCLQSETAGITSTYAYDIRSRQTTLTSDRYSQWLEFTPGGNVSRMKWQTNVPGDVERSYAYSYDGLSRLTSADYYDAGGKHGLYSTWYDYDLNGNVTSLTRRGITEVGVGVKKEGVIDCLTYEYRGNQVTRISDDAPELTYFNAFHFVDGADDDVEYTYDSSGNTVSDLNRGIDRITYDVNHRPRTISFSNGAHTGYIYDAQGRKLHTEHRVPSLQPTIPGAIGA